MKKLIALILIAAGVFGAWQAVKPRLEEKRLQSAAAREQSQEDIAESLLNGKFISLLSDEQLEKIADKIKNSNLLAEDGPIRNFLEKQCMTPEQFLENIRKKSTLGKLKNQFEEYLTDQYCQENGVSRAEVPEESLKAYRKKVITRMAGDLIENLKEAK